MPRRSTTHSYLPAAYLLASLGLVAAVLPTALRPPSAPPPTSAELSPDAPPEDSEVLLSELSQGRSRTAGSGVPEAVAESADVPVNLPDPPAPARGQCFGDPPRQIESVYSAPCVAAWTGDNGGETSRGVTADEIRVATFVGPIFDGDGSYDGPVPTEPQPDESAAVRTYRVLQAYFNKHMELYGRQARFYYVKSGRDSNDATQNRSAAYRAAEAYQVFAAQEDSSVGTSDELTRRGVITFTNNHAGAQFYKDRRPYLWSATADSTAMVTLSAEYLCKKLAGSPPVYTNDPSFDYSAPRKFGILAFQDGDGEKENAPLMKRLIRRQCGAEVAETIEYNIVDPQQQSSGIARMRVAGVTTIISMMDWFTAPGWTAAADAAGYFPEWYIAAVGGTDVNPMHHSYSRTQWSHAFGISFYEVPTANLNDRECYRAYHEIDPENDPAEGLCRDFNWAQLVQLLSGIQMAGPSLTPETFERAMYALGRHPPTPSWRMAGGYGPGPPAGFSVADYPGDWTYPDYAIEIWYDVEAVHPTDGRPGAYRYLVDSGRFTHGTVPPGESPQLFKDGVLSAPH